MSWLRRLFTRRPRREQADQRLREHVASAPRLRRVWCPECAACEWRKHGSVECSGEHGKGFASVD